jgi:hypothetical protein
MDMVRRNSIPPVERITQVFELHDGDCALTFNPQDRLFSSSPRLRQYSFQLCRKATQFGDIRVDQVWMPHGSVYGQRNSTASNRDSIVNAFWSLCRRAGSDEEDDGVKDSYLLAKLLPEVRSNGSRRVFQDAVTARETIALRQRLLSSLEERLASGRNHRLDMVSFRDQTAILLGPPSYEEEVWCRYRHYEAELFDEGHQALEQGRDAEGALARWRSWMTGVSRRRGNDLDKLVLDIFSYECRAALHRCYSAVWVELLPLLTERYAFTNETVRFHRLWHLEQSTDSNDLRAQFHLFHGHIFGLHPGTYLFAQTRTGGELIGEALIEPRLGPAFERLLNGLMLAMYEFSERTQGNRDRRRGRARQWNDALGDTLQYEHDFSIDDE